MILFTHSNFIKEVVSLRAIQQWLDRFCAKHPRLSIPGLMRYIVIGNVLVYLLDMFSKSGYAMGTGLLGFSASAILQGQVWRLVTFIFVPVSNSSIFFFLVTLYFYYFIGNALENEWGSNKFTIFYLFGVILNIAVGFLVGTASMFYVNMSMFFAFATLFPNLQVLFFFIIPVKVKWLAWFNAAFFVLSIVRYLMAGKLLLALLPVVAILNYLLFFAGDISGFLSRGCQRTGWQRARRGPKVVDFHAAKPKHGYLHKCSVCGRTDVSDPQLEFRYCSKCRGYHCYCQDYLNTHIHIQ